MPGQEKYRRQREFIEALHSGKITPGAVAARHDLEALLSGDYQSPQFFFWLRDYWEDFSHGICKRGAVRSPKTIIGARKEYFRFAKWCLEVGLDTRPVVEVRAVDLKPYLDKFRGKTRTWWKMYQNLRQLFNYLRRHEECSVTHSPLEKIPRLPYKAKPTKIVDGQLIEKLYYAIENILRRGSIAEASAARAYDRALLDFMLVTGSRRSGPTTLRLGRINWDEGSFEYDDKGSMNIVAPLDESLRQSLQEYIRLRKMPEKRRGESDSAFNARIAAYNATASDERKFDPMAPDDFVFRNANGFPANEHSITATFIRWSRWLKTHIHPHQIRKFRGRQAYVDSGNDIEATRVLMNHSTIAMTQQYLGVSTAEKLEFMRSTSPLARYRRGSVSGG